MKFDIIDALKKAYEIVGHECTINCSLNDEGYLIQIKVLVLSDVAGNQVYGQQVAIREGDWFIDDLFDKALFSLKLQIDGANNDNNSM